MVVDVEDVVLRDGLDAQIVQQPEQLCAMIGAVIIGEMTELSAAAISPQYKEVVAFGVLVLVMMFRPQGLLAKRGALAAAG